MNKSEASSLLRSGFVLPPFKTHFCAIPWHSDDRFPRIVMASHRPTEKHS